MIDFLWTIFRYFIYALALFVTYKLVREAMHYFAIRKARDEIVHYKVLVPRNDSQKDRQEETEKDFREKIGIMSQFYRSLHEIRELDLRNRIRVWLYGMDIVSFQLVCRNSLIEFHVTTFMEYADIVEKTITSYYPHASIDVTEPPKLDREGYFVRAYYAYLVKPFWYPIKMYKEIESDPLNGMTNTLSKLKEDELAVVQINITPKSSKWRKRANKYGTEMFKGKKEGGFLSSIPVLGHLNSFFVGMLFGFDEVQGRTNEIGRASCRERVSDQV